MKTTKEDSIEMLKSSHTKKEIRKRLHKRIKHSYLRDFIYGAIDGSVTTFAVVSGVAGANLPSDIVIIMGMANLVADGFSMAISNFLATRADEELRSMARRREEQHIKQVPDGEREEVRQIFAQKGFQGEELEKAVRIITSNRKRWVDTMLTDELGLALEGSSPGMAALTTFFSFSAIGFIPLLPFVINDLFPSFALSPFITSTGLTGAAFFAIGSLKSRYVGRTWFRAGLETFLIGSIAAGFAYCVGALIKSIVSI